MAGPNVILDKGWKAAGAITQYRCVELGTAETVSQCNAANDPVLGVAQETISAADATAGRIALIRVCGISRCIAGEAFAIGAKLRVDATGKVIDTMAAAGTVNNQVGIALQAAVADGDHVDVLLTPGVSHNTAVS